MYLCLLYKEGNYDVKMSYIKKAKEIVDRNLPQAQKSLSIDEFMSLVSEMGMVTDDESRVNVTKKTW